MPKKLPKGWVETTLGEVCRINPRLSPDEMPAAQELLSFVPMAAVEEETGRLDPKELRTFQEVRRGYTPFRENDVIFAKITPCMENGKIALASGLHGGIAFGSTEFVVFRAWPGVVPRYVLHFLLQNSFRHAAQRQMTGAVGQKRVPVAYLTNHVFPLAPAAEQERIVAKLDATFARLDAGEAALRRGRERLKRYRAAVLNAAVTGELTKEWRKANPPEEPGAALLKRLLIERRKKWEAAELAKMREKGKEPKDDKWKARYPEPQAPDTTNLPRLPRGWTWATVDQLAAHEARAITDGPFGSNLKTSHYTDKGPRVIRLQNIGDGVFIDEKAHISKKHFESLREHEVRAGDIVIRALGIPTPQACRIPEAVGPAIVKADCIRFRVTEPEVSAGFALFALNAPGTRARTMSLIHGVGRPRLNLGEIKAIALPLPPHNEQKEIRRLVASAAKAADRLGSRIEQKTARLRQQRQACLRDAFEGRLVKQDSNDDTASILLAGMT